MTSAHHDDSRTDNAEKAREESLLEVGRVVNIADYLPGRNVEVIYHPIPTVRLTLRGDELTNQHALIKAGDQCIKLFNDAFAGKSCNSIELAGKIISDQDTHGEPDPITGEQTSLSYVVELVLSSKREPSSSSSPSMSSTSFEYSSDSAITSLSELMDDHQPPLFTHDQQGVSRG